MVPFAIQPCRFYYPPMQTAAHRTFSESSIVIVGVGLIGGSIAAAVRHRFPNCNVVGIGRNRERLSSATDKQLLTSWSDSICSSAIPEKSLGIVCLPVNQIAASVRQLLDCGCELVTDAGSVKASVYSDLGDVSKLPFVGSHPIAGSEHSGFEHADSNLFEGRRCVVTIMPGSPSKETSGHIERVVAFWESIGSTVHLMSPEEHDRVLALTSHLPHVLAAVASGCVGVEMLPFTGTGYRDTTRIAAGSASLWASILQGNSKHCINAIRSAEDLLKKYREALEMGDSKSLEDLWEISAQRRRML